MRCLLALTFASMLFAGGALAIVDGDLYHELAYFREVLATGGFPERDPFSFTSTIVPLIHHEWGFGAIAFGAAIGSGFGAPGILLLKWTLALLLALLALREARARGGDLPALASCAIPAVILTWGALATVRAHLFTLVMLAILLAFLRRDRGGDRRWMFAFLLLQVIWQNVHGGFVAGLALIGVEALERALRRERFAHLLALLAAAALVVAVNPWGFGYHAYLFRALRMDRPLILEWASLFSDPSIALPIYSLAVGLVILVAIRRGLAPLVGIGIVAFTAYQAARHQRFLPLFALAFFVHAPGWIATSTLGDALRAFFTRRRFAIQYFAAILATAMIAQAISRRGFDVQVPSVPAPPSEHRYPVGPVRHLAACGFEGNLLTAFGDGSYVTWHLHPAVKVSLDSRYEVAYRDDLIDEHDDFLAARPGYADYPAALGADLVLVPRSTPLALALAREGGTRFSLRYRDGSYELWQPLPATLPFLDRGDTPIHGEFP
jgi:hypothetical protein